MNEKFNAFNSIWLPFQYCPIIVLLIAFFTFIMGIIPAIETLVIADFIDSAIKLVSNSELLTKVIFNVIIIITLISLKWLSKIIKNILAVRLEIDLLKFFRTSITEKRSSLEYYYIEDSETWDLITRVTENPELRLKNALINFFDLIALIIQMVGVMAIIFVQSYYIAIILLIIMIPLVFISLKSGKVNYLVKQETQKFHRRHEDLQKNLVDKDACQERSLFNFTQGISKMWYKYYEKARKAELKTQIKWYLKSKIGGIITTVISTISSLFLLEPVLNHKMSIGMFVSLINAMYSLVNLVSWQLAIYVEQIANNAEYMKDYNTFMHLKESGEDKRGKVECTEFVSLEFKNVSFKYPNTNVYVLKNFSYKFEKNISYALVGKNGAGKSTLVKIMIGLYKDFEGSIKLNNIDINEFDPNSLRKIFSTVFQDFAKYYLSIQDTIGIGNLESYLQASKIDLIEVAKSTGIMNQIDDYPNNFHTMLGKIYEDGIEISGGQWQRVAIARALYRNAPFCILDEPTSALDPVSETNLYSEFRDLSKNRTLLLISHRLGSTKIAERILVLEDGKLIEEGSHCELMNKNGVYSFMYKSQRSWYNE